MSHNLYYPFIHQRFRQASYKSTQHVSKPVIYNVLPNSILKLPHPCRDCFSSKGPRFTRHLNVSTEHLDTVTSYHIDFSFSKISPVRNSPLP